MNSFNHYAYGAIGKWMYQVVAGIGIDEDNPGYKHILINPRPGGGLTSAKATHNSLYGTIASGWFSEGENFTMEVEIPANTTATIHVPKGASEIKINGSDPGGSGFDFKEVDGQMVGKVGSGEYTIECKLIF
jgi:alpha-L-rhamnosidase